MSETTPVATFQTWHGADDAAALLRSNAIRCAVVGTPPPIPGALVSGVGSLDYTIVVAVEDACRARQTLAAGRP